MSRVWTSLFVLAAGLAWSAGASACSCMGIDNAGFVHADVKRLPANAKGALFLRPQGTFQYLASVDPGIAIVTGEMQQLSPASFRITADTQQGDLRAELSYPDATIDAASPEPTRYYRFVRKSDERLASAPSPAQFAALLKKGALVEVTQATEKAMSVVRVGPAGGFKPGKRYRIAYLGKAERWRFPAEVEHAIDTTPLVASTAFRLIVDGPPAARLLPLTTVSGACSSSQPALVQNFRYVLPAGYAKYQAAMIFASTSAPVAGARGKGRRYEQMVYQPSLCPVEPFMSTAFPAGRDIVHARCEAKPAPVTVKGWAGMLEVEDRLHPTDTIHVDLGKAAGGSCTGFGMLASALESGDNARIKDLACSLEREELRDHHLAPEPIRDFPVAALYARFGAPDRELQRCARKAAIRLFNETPVIAGDRLAAYAALVRSDLESSDPAQVAIGAEGLRELSMDLRRNRDGLPPGSSAEQLLASVLDAMVRALIANRAPETAELAPLLERVKRPAGRHVPTLLAAAGSSAAGAANAMSALEVLIGDDPRLHRVLLGNARRPHLQAHAALIYARVAGARQPEMAVKLLIDAGRAGSRQSVEAIETFRSRGRAAAPVLMQLMRSATDSDMRSAALSALIAVSDGDPAALRAVGDALNSPVLDRPSYYGLDGLATIGPPGQLLLPAYQARMRKPMSKELKETLAKSIVSMRLAPSRRDLLLARLEAAPLGVEKE